jgi:hypothetical protein
MLDFALTLSEQTALRKLGQTWRTWPSLNRRIASFGLALVLFHELGALRDALEDLANSLIGVFPVEFERSHAAFD